MIGAFFCAVAWYGIQGKAFAQTRNQEAFWRYAIDDVFVSGTTSGTVGGANIWRYSDYADGSIYGTIANVSIMNTSTTLGTLNNYLRRGEFGSIAACGCVAAGDPCRMSACAPCGKVTSQDGRISGCNGGCCVCCKGGCFGGCGAGMHDHNCDGLGKGCRNDSGCGTDCGKGCGSAFSPRKNCRNLWGLAYGTGGSTQFDGNVSGYNQGFFGTIVGLDRLYGNTTRAGLYVSYGEGRISKNLNQTSDSKELLVGLYLRKEMEIGYVILNGGLGYDQYDTERQFIGNWAAKSKHSGFVGTAYAERGLEFQGEYVKWQPFFGLQYIGNQQQGFTENGICPLNLAGDITTANSFRSLLGIRLSTNLARTHRGSLALFGQSIWMHEFLNETSTNFTGKFAALPNNGTYTVSGNNAGRDWAILGTGLTYDTRQWRLFAGYDISMNERQVLHTGNAGAVYGW